MCSGQLAPGGGNGLLWVKVQAAGHLVELSGSCHLSGRAHNLVIEVAFQVAGHLVRVWLWSLLEWQDIKLCGPSVVGG